MSTQFTLHGGIDTIGGTIIAVMCEGHRLIFDMGRVHHAKLPAFDAVLLPRSIRDLQHSGNAPQLHGVFQGDEEWDGKTLLALSHNHLDHTGLLPYVQPQIPILVSPDTHHMMTALDLVSDGFRKPLNYEEIPFGQVREFGPFRILLTPVDHDTPGASAMLIETPDMRMVYSGDLRLHGLHPNWTEDFAAMASAFEPDVLWIEGTRSPAVNNDNILKERDIEPALVEGLHTATGAYFTFYPRHPERVHSLLNAVKATSRTLVLTAESAYLFDEFEGPTAGDTFLLLSDDEQTWSPALAQRVKERGWKTISSRELHGRDREFFVQLPYPLLGSLIDIKPAQGSKFFHMNGNPLGPHELAWDNLHRWLQYFGVDFVYTGSTGHGSRSDIHQLISQINPRVVMPIHSLQPQRIGVSHIARILPVLGKAYTQSDLQTAGCPTQAELDAANAD
ncbi:MAG: MBL fold metallo-hydrolase [Alicyclobacillaceae bacterium]|nr:MBL fold metallo-hydrolase [Alicyclobacillaceae bacterium]